MGKNKSKNKGYRIEKLIEELLQSSGIQAERIPLSGSMGGKYDSDLVIGTVDNPIYRCEVKARKDGQGFKTLENWKGDNDILFLKRNYQDPMVVMDIDIFIELLNHLSQVSSSNQENLKEQQLHLPE